MRVKNQQIPNSQEKTFFSKEQVKDGKIELSPLLVIKSLLRAKAMKQSELAEEIGLSRQALNNYIRGHWTIPSQIKIKISQTLGVDSSAIWDLEERT